MCTRANLVVSLTVLIVVHTTDKLIAYTNRKDSCHMSKERLNIYLPNRLKRRLKELSEDTDVSMNDIAVDAIKNQLDRADTVNSAPDIVLDRLGQVLNTLILIAQDTTDQDIKQLLEELEETQQSALAAIQREQVEIKDILIDIRNRQQ